MIIAIIGAAATISVAIIAAVVELRKRKSEHSEPPQSLPKRVPSVPIKQSRSKKTRKSHAPSIGLSHKAIVDNIERVPPFQRDAVRKTFLGRRVCWVGKLGTMSRIREEDFHVSVHLEHHTLVFANARLQDLQGLEALEEGAPVEIVGTLERISRYEAHVKDAAVRAKAKIADTSQSAS